MWNAQLSRVQIKNEACKPLSACCLQYSEVIGQVVDIGSGRFVSTREGFIPMDLEKHPVLLEKWLVYASDTKGLHGLRFRNSMQYVKKDGETLSWGTYVYGRQVEENPNWVQVDNLFLPVRFKDGRQVLWRESEPVQPDPSALSSTRSVRLCLLAPPGTYKVTGTFTQDWQQRLALQPEDLPGVGSKGLYVYYIDVPYSDLNFAHFKFQKAEMGRLRYWQEFLTWEVEGEGQNRVFMANSETRSGTRVFMSYGDLKATPEDRHADSLAAA